MDKLTDFMFRGLTTFYKDSDRLSKQYQPVGYAKPMGALERFFQIFKNFIIEIFTKIHILNRCASFDYMDYNQLTDYFNSIGFKFYSVKFDLKKLKEIAFFLRDFIDYKGVCSKTAEFMSIYGDCDVTCVPTYKRWFRSNMFDHVAVDINPVVGHELANFEHLANFGTKFDVIKYVYDGYNERDAFPVTYYVHILDRPYFTDDNELINDFKYIAENVLPPHVKATFILE